MSRQPLKRLSYFNRNYFELLLAFTEKEIKIRYKQTILGLGWSLLLPILQMAIIGFVFSFFIKLEIKNYFLLLLAGLLPWEFFIRSWLKSTTVFVEQRQILQKAYFPREILVVSIILGNLFDLLLALPLLLFLTLLLGHLEIVNIIIYLLMIFCLTWFTIGISLLTASLEAHYRDVNFIVQAISRLWFYATPIVYFINLIPKNWQFIFAFNPLSTIFIGFQQIVVPLKIPLYLIGGNVFICFLVVFIGFFCFYKLQSSIVDYV